MLDFFSFAVVEHKWYKGEVGHGWGRRMEMPDKGDTGEPGNRWFPDMGEAERGWRRKGLWLAPFSQLEIFKLNLYFIGQTNL